MRGEGPAEGLARLAIVTPSNVFLEKWRGLAMPRFPSMDESWCSMSYERVSPSGALVPIRRDLAWVSW
jgi:hypothetical protein